MQMPEREKPRMPVSGAWAIAAIIMGAAVGGLLALVLLVVLKVVGV